MNLVSLPLRDLTDIAGGLRRLADSVEAGEYDDAHGVVWVIDCGSGRVELGMLGRSQSGMPGSEAHFILALGQRKLESVAE